MDPRLVRHLTTSWRLAGLAVACGAISALAQAPISLPFFLLLSLPALGWLALNSQSRRHGFLTGWWAGFGYFAAALFWIVEPFFVEPEVFGWMAPFALAFTAGGMAMFWGGGFYLAGFTAGRRVYRLLALAVSWTVFEFIRSHIFTGFPWGLLGYVWSETPLFQFLAYIGPHGLGLMTLLLGFLPLVASRKLLIGASYTVVLSAVLWVGGGQRLPESTVYPDDPTLVRLLQPNAPQHLKWKPDMVPVFFKRLLDLTKTPANPPPDVVIWPETSVPFLLGDNTVALQAVADAAGPETQVVAGIRRREDARIYNSMVYLDEAGGILSVYDKHHLVPFGEYIPFASLLSKFGLRGLAAEDGGGFSAGRGVRIINASGLPDFLPLICYEAIFPGLVQAEAGRPEWLLHLTNDAWFGSASGPYQHFLQVRARAIEQGLPVARSANTGVSAMIDPYGVVLRQIPLNQSGFLDAPLPAALAPTLYARYGEFIWLTIAALFAIATILDTRSALRLTTDSK
ncbi:MAG: apolipoprotein N-acyltransferase [Rhodobacteraceae bacterium]|nr:apolipoprotein N-acyltransferase [Paracoccaceae bacterium]